MKFCKQIGMIVIAAVMLLSLNRMIFAEEPTIGSITIHKFEVDNLIDYNMIGDGTELNSGTEIAPGQTLGTLKPLAGIPFKITAVQLKISATSGSIDVSDYEPIPDSNPGAFTDTKTTGADGTISWKDMAFGLYLIEELSGNTANNVVTPFIIQLPLTNPAGTGFIYDVHVYPKNEVTGPKVDKTLVPPAPETGTNILTWKISAEIPNGIKDAKNMVITDVLDSRLDYFDIRGYYTNKDGNQTLLTDSDYTLNVTGNLLTISITATGFATLDGALSGTGAAAPMLFFEIDTMIKMGTIPAWDPITNTPILDFTNADDYTYDPKTPVTPPTANLHGIEIYKIDGYGATLEGAKFKIYPTRTDANNRTNALRNPASMTDDWEIVTDPGGYAYFNGLSYGTFWIVETQAPPGYNLLNGPVGVIVADDATSIVMQQIINNRGFTLPITGGAGTILFTVGGLLLIGIAIVFFIFSRKKKTRKYGSY